jgi:hypothetical protein
MRKIMRCGLFCLALVFIIFWSFPVDAAVQVRFEENIIREKGKPELVTYTFQGTEGQASIKLYNGGQDQNPGKISSAVVSINGATIFSESQFNQKVSYLEKNITLSLGDNTLSVNLNSKPGGKIKIQISQEVEDTLLGYAAANVGDLGIVSLTTDNKFHYEIIDGKLQGKSNTIQLEEYTEYPELDGFFLKANYLDDTNNNSIRTSVPIFFKFSNDIIGAYIDSDPNLKIDDGYITTILISKLGNQLGLPSNFPKDNYNAITCLFGRTGISLSGFSIGDEGAVSVTPSLKEMEGVPPDEFTLTQSQIGSNIFKAVNGDTVLNIIHEGTSMIIDSPGGGSYANGFGAAIKAADLDFSAIENGKKFYFLDLFNGFAFGNLYPNPENRSIDYSIQYVNIDFSITGTFVNGQQTCGGVSLPNDGLGWLCDTDKGFSFIIDPVQGILAAFQPPKWPINTPQFWIGGW